MSYVSKASIIDCIQRDEPERLATLLHERKSFLGIDDLSRALLLSSEKGLKECVGVLLSAKVNPDLHSLTGFTPLIIASKNGHAGIVELLIRSGCRVNKSTFQIRASALHWAAANGHMACANALLKSGINREAQTIHGRTPMMLAARNGHDNIVKLLIECGCHINRTDYEKASALHHAAIDGELEVAQLLINHGVDINAQMRYGETALVIAARNGHTHFLKLLLNVGANVHLTAHSMTSLHWASIGGFYQCVHILLETDLDANAATDCHYIGGDYVVETFVTPLMLAAKHCHPTVVQQLIEFGVDLNCLDAQGFSALHYASKYANAKCACLLLHAGADSDLQSKVFETDKIGIPALFLAVQRREYSIVIELMRANCRLDFVHNGTTAFDVALSEGNFTMVQIFLLAGFKPSMAMTPLQRQMLSWIMQDQTEVFCRLQDLMFSPQPLMYICRWCIRHVLGRPIIELINELTLPLSIKRFLDFQDLEELI